MLPSRSHTSKLHSFLPSLARHRVRTLYTPLFLIFFTFIFLPHPTSFAQQVDERWSWPTGGPVPVVRSFDPPELPWLSGHRGVDLDVPIGSAVHAPSEGRVIYAGPLAGRGVLSIEHQGKHGPIRSTFEPVEVLVAQGDWVSRGQVVATVQAGHAPGNLHWGAKISRTRWIDPLRMLTGETVLKPW